MTDWPSASTQLPRRAPRPWRTRLVPLKPTSMMTCDPRAIVGATGATAGVVPAVTTSGLYTCTCPAGDRMVASTNAPSVPALAIEQPSPSCHGVARPAALSGLFGTVRVQFIDAAACAAVWFRLIAAPVPSTGLVATSPSWKNAVRPLALLGAGATAAAATAAPPLALADGHGAALAAAAGLPETAGLAALAAFAAFAALAEGEAHAPVADWLMVLTGPPETARMIPRVSPNAIGMARGTAMRAARLFLPRRRHADRCPLSIQSTSMDVRCDAPGGSR